MAELIVVLDVDEAGDALALVDRCGSCTWFKVGVQLFSRCGPQIVREIQNRGKEVMLDLKFHDIPNTVGNASRAAADLGVGMFTLHASGGRRMISAAREAVEDTETQILAVTILTSLDEGMLRSEVGMPEAPERAVPRLASMAVDSGAHGVVCSPLEVELVRRAVGPAPLLVTPGVRPKWSGHDDQQRVMTPGDAARAGANFIVVGRPILQHDDPAVAVELIKEELS